MKKIYHIIPNALTLGNLIAGCIGILFLIEGDIFASAYLIWLAAFLDFLDGSAARFFHSNSVIGKQLDSLADLASFGVLPSLIMFVMVMENTEIIILPYITISIAVFGAIRLARYNLDDSQAFNFRGLPIPASALLISGLTFWSKSEISLLRTFASNPYFLTAIAIILSSLMVSGILFPSLKIKNFRSSTNYFIAILGIVSLGTIPIFGYSSISIIIFIYIMMALFMYFFNIKMSE